MAEPTKGKEKQLPVATILKAWIEYTSGTFRIEQLYAAFPDYAKDPVTKRYFSTVLSRLVKEGYIERDGTRYGHFRRIERTLETMDFINADDKAVDIWLPFDITNMVEIMPSNIIIFAGEKEVGKTTIALNIAWANRKTWDVHYFNFEMGRNELKKRLKKFKNTDLMDWAQNISFYQRSNAFHDVIKTGENQLNIIDYIAVAGDEYPFVSLWIRQIHEKIIETGAVCIIFLEKPPGRDTGTGGLGTLDIPRLYIAVSRGAMKIITAKNWVNDDNPRDKEMTFKIVKGAELIANSDWTKELRDRWSG